MDKTREIALKILYKIDKEGAFSNIVLDEEINKNRNKLQERDIGLCVQRRSGLRDIGRCFCSF